MLQPPSANACPMIRSASGSGRADQLAASRDIDVAYGAALQAGEGAPDARATQLKMLVSSHHRVGAASKAHADAHQTAVSDCCERICMRTVRNKRGKRRNHRRRRGVMIAGQAKRCTAHSIATRLQAEPCDEHTRLDKGALKPWPPYLSSGGLSWSEISDCATATVRKVRAIPQHTGSDRLLGLSSRSASSYSQMDCGRNLTQPPA